MDKHEPTQRKYSVADTTSAGGVNPLLNRPWTFNPRHLRVRLRWVGFSSTSSAIHTAPATEPLGGKTTISALPQVFQLFDPRKLQVRVTWIGFGSMDNTLKSASTSAQVVERVSIPSFGRV